MIILLTFRSFAREKKQESSENFTIVLNLFAEIIVHSAFLHWYLCIRRWESKAIIRSLKPQGVRLYRYLCTFLDIPPFPPLDSHFMERQQQEISVKPFIKNEIKKFYSSI